MQFLAGVIALLISTSAWAEPLILNIYRHDGSLKDVQEMDDTNSAMIAHTVKVSALGYICVAGVNINATHPEERVLNIVALDGSLILTNLDQ